MKHHSLKGLGFACAVILCPVLTAGSLSPAFAANNIEIDSSISGPVWGNSDDNSGANSQGDATGNSVHLTGDGEVKGFVSGSYSDTQDVSGNTVTLDDGAEVAGYVYGGEAGGDQGAIDNHVVMNGYNAIANGNVYGGGSWDAGEVKRNSVTITDSYVAGSVFGGRGNALVSDNTVTLNAQDAEVTSSVYGGRGYGANSVVSGNEVIINEGAVNGSNVAGGWGEQTAVVSGNTATINGGGINAAVYGGRGEDSAEVSGNRVFIKGGEINNHVYGGGNGESGEVSGNTVEITGGTVNGSAFGGAGKAQVSNNHVTLNGEDTEVLSSVYGGRGEGDTSVVSGNTVTVNGGAVQGANVAGGWGSLGSLVSGNTVTINDGTINANVHGGRGEDASEVSGNSVFINGGLVESDAAIYGGYSDSGEVTGNSVKISNGTVSASFIYGGRSNSEAVGNSVVISGGIMDGGATIYGGSGASGAAGNSVAISDGTVNAAFIIGGRSISGEATGNSVEISGGVLGDNVKIYGGYADTAATGNTVTISGTPTWGDNILLHGAYSASGDDAFSGNSLNLKTQGLTVSELANFEYLNFYLPADFKADETMLTVTGTADLTDGADRSSIVNVGIDGNSSALKAGDSMVLIDAGTLVTNADLNETATGYGKQGSTLDYLFSLATDGNKLLATVEGVKASEGSKSFSEGVVSGLALATQGADLAAGEGLGQAVSAAALNGFGSFGAMGAGSLKYDTGSSVDVNGFSLMTGLAFGNDLEAGRLTLGAFFEYGNGSYDTHNSFSGVSVDGGGDTDYVGGGILGRMDFADTASGHFYTEASARMGRVSNEFNGSDLIRAYYDSSASYFGLHAGLGYVWNLSEKTFLDLYGKYLWTHQGGDSVKLSTGDPLEFEAADSHRVRAGARLSYQASDSIAPYVGAAYEHEFDGKAMATTYGKAIDAPDMKGGTGIGELGLTLKPSPDSPVSFDLGVQGYTGLREGVTGSLQIKFEF